VAETEDPQDPIDATFPKSGGLSRLVTMAALGASVLACESHVDITGFPDPVGVETRQFIVALRGLGATAEVVVTVPPASSLLSAPTTRVQVNGVDVFVFEFASAAEVDAAVARVPGILALTLFPSRPHFFRGNRIIVLYVGTDAAVIALLERLLGPQFAGL
jgi:hypothetical protein